MPSPLAASTARIAALPDQTHAMRHYITTMQRLVEVEALPTSVPDRVARIESLGIAMRRQWVRMTEAEHDAINAVA